jgi:hypothetical protein
VPDLERGTHDGGDVVCTVGGVEEGFGSGRDVAAMMQHDLPHLHADLGAAGLPGAHDRPTLPVEPLAQQLRLRGLA